MKNAQRIFELVVSCFGMKPKTEDDRVWEEWLDLEDGRREPRDLVGLLHSDVRDEFKARALTILLAPAFHLVPFKWTGERTSRNNLLWLDLVDFEKLPENLFRFGGELICNNVDLMKKQQNNTEARDALDIYNRLIVVLLALLPANDELAQRLFDRFLIQDPVAFWNMEEASGYRPLERLFWTTNVPEHWKVLADAQMRKTILAESTGKAVPRKEWEEALRQYASMIQLLASTGKQFYSNEMFVSQIRFILELPGVDNRPIFNAWQVGEIFSHLDGNEQRGLRHRFCRHVVLGKREHGEFSVYDDGTRAAAEAMLAEFSYDRDLETALLNLLAAGAEKAAKNADRAQKRQATRTAVHNKMK